MAISRVGFVSLPAATNTGWACAIPAGVQDNDVAYVAVCKASSTNPSTVPSGYALLEPISAGGSNNFTWWYAKVLAAADAGANHVWGWASTTGTGACLILRGCDTAQVLDVTDPPDATILISVTSITTPASATVTDGAWALWTCSVGTAGTQSWPATVNGNAVTVEMGTGSGRLGMAWATYPTAGTVSAGTISLSASTRCTAKTLLPKPATAAAGTATQRWTGSAWTPVGAVQRWDGSGWVTATVKRWNGSGWV